VPAARAVSLATGRGFKLPGCQVATAGLPVAGDGRLSGAAARAADEAAQAVVPMIITRIELWKTKRLVPLERNPRTHSDAQVAQIAASMREFGFLWPIMVNGETREIVAGNGRYMAVARALGRMRADDCVTTLMGALQDEAWQVRAQAAWALGRTRSGLAILALPARLTDPAWWVRRHAAYALREFGMEGHRELERIACGSPDPYARDMAREVLEGWTNAA